MNNLKRRVEMTVRSLLKHPRQWRYIGKHRIRVMKKLDKSKVNWIIQEKRKGAKTNKQIADSMGVSVIWIKKLWSRYRNCMGPITYPAKMGRPENGLPGRREHSAVLSVRGKHRKGAVRAEQAIKQDVGIHITHNTIHQIMRDNDLADKQPKKSQQRKWVRYERTYSNSMWHTDYKQLDDGRWFLCYQDDASRFVTGYGVFEHATTENAISVLEDAIKKHGKPASILTDHGSQFYANASEIKKKGESMFEKKLVEFGIRQILARVNHPQTNGKLERLHGEIQRYLHEFEEESADKTTRGSCGDHVGGPFHTAPLTDAVSRFIEWYNLYRAHRSLDWENQETPAQAFVRKMPPKDVIVIDEQTGEEYDVK